MSLRAAIELGYVEDTFHRRSQQNPSWGTATLEGVLRNDFGPSYDSSEVGDAEIWLRGYLFNTGLVRMAALTERGLIVLWERANGSMSGSLHRVADYHFWKLAKWYKKAFDKKLAHLERVRTQVNVFKHDHLSVRVDTLETVNDALQAFEELFFCSNWVSSLGVRS